MTKKSEKHAENCFFVTPIGNEGTAERQRADWVFYQVVEPAANGAGLIAERADLMLGSSMIGTNIFRALSEAPMCVADLTGLNPNVLYEIGVRHCLRKPIVHIAQHGTQLPFDNAPHMTLFYDLADYMSVKKLKNRVEEEFNHILSETYEVSNPFTQALGNIELSKSGDPIDSIVSNLAERLSRLESYNLNRNNTLRAIGSWTQEDAAKALLGFIGSAGREDNYNVETFNRALELTASDSNLHEAVGTALSTCKRANKSELEDIYFKHVAF